MLHIGEELVNVQNLPAYFLIHRSIEIAQDELCNTENSVSHSIKKFRRKLLFIGLIIELPTNETVSLNVDVKGECFVPNWIRTTGNVFGAFLAVRSADDLDRDVRIRSVEPIFDLSPRYSSTPFDRHEQTLTTISTYFEHLIFVVALGIVQTDGGISN